MTNKNGRRVDSKGRVLPKGITQRANGLYQARVYMNGKEYPIYSRSLSEIKEKYIEIQNDLNKGILSNLESISLNEWYDKWIEKYAKKKLRPRTYENYKSYWNKNVKDSIVGKMAISKIKNIHIVDLYTELTERNEKPLAHSTVKYINSMMYAAFESAIKNGLISINPAKDVMNVIKGRKAQKRHAVTEREMVSLFNFITGTRYEIYKPLFTVLFGTGARLGEILSLTADDIDFENETININKTLHYGKTDYWKKCKFYLTPPKTESSIRRIPMLPQVKEALERQICINKVFINSNGYSVPLFDKDNNIVGECKGFIFTTSKGTLYIDDTINRVIKTVIRLHNEKEVIVAEKENREAVIIQKFTAHCTRHTFATQAFENDLRSLTISNLLGHKSERTTKEIYTHISEDIGKKEILLLAGMKIS